MSGNSNRVETTLRNYFLGNTPPESEFQAVVSGIVDTLNKFPLDEQEIVRKKFHCPCSVVANCDPCRAALTVLVKAVYAHVVAKK